MTAPGISREFRAAYAGQRAAEGRGYRGDELLALPYLRSGALAAQWRVRSCTFDAFMRAVFAPAARRLRRSPRLLDVGAGNGWLCRRAAAADAEAVALDVRDDAVDGLGAAAELAALPGARFERVAGSFDALPLAARTFDVVVFNASLHYALDLAAVLAEARRVATPGGAIAILDSPFYRRERDGEAMVAEKRRDGRRAFGERADTLGGVPFIEYLTAGRLTAASAALGLHWRRHRVLYPLSYELRPLTAWARRRRPPSRFDCWECTVP